MGFFPAIQVAIQELPNNSEALLAELEELLVVLTRLRQEQAAKQKGGVRPASEALEYYSTLASACIRKATASRRISSDDETSTNVGLAQTRASPLTMRQRQNAYYFGIDRARGPFINTGWSKYVSLTAWNAVATRCQKRGNLASIVRCG